MKYRSVPISEIARCPSHRLDPEHYIPHHKTDECRKVDKKKTMTAVLRQLLTVMGKAQAVVEAWCWVPTRCQQCHHHLDRYEKWDEMEQAIDALDALLKEEGGEKK